MPNDVVRPILIDVPRCIETPRLLIRPFERADALELFERIDASRDTLRPLLPWVDATQTADDSRETIAQMRGNWETHTDLAVGVIRREDGRVLGGSGLHRIDWDTRAFEVGYWLASDAVGYGYMTECVAALTSMAFEALDANRVEIRLDPTNERSRAVPVRLGFVYEGRLRRNVATDGDIRDTDVFGLVPGDPLPYDPAATDVSWA